jgi:hypothetical protein
VENSWESVENFERLCGNVGESVGKSRAKDKNCKQFGRKMRKTTQKLALSISQEETGERKRQRSD